MPNIRTFYDASDVFKTIFEKPSRTDKTQIQHNDIKSLIESVLRDNNGSLPPRPPEEYFDCTFDDAQLYEIMAKKEAIFAALPSHVRLRYGNDPANLEYVLDEHPELFAIKDNRLSVVDEHNQDAIVPKLKDVDGGEEE